MLTKKQLIEVRVLISKRLLSLEKVRVGLADQLLIDTYTVKIRDTQQLFDIVNNEVNTKK